MGTTQECSALSWRNPETSTLQNSSYMATCFLSHKLSKCCIVIFDRTVNQGFLGHDVQPCKKRCVSVNSSSGLTTGNSGRWEIIYIRAPTLDGQSRSAIWSHNQGRVKTAPSVSRVNWSNPGKGIVPSFTPQCSSC